MSIFTQDQGKAILAMCEQMQVACIPSTTVRFDGYNINCSRNPTGGPVQIRLFGSGSDILYKSPDEFFSRTCQSLEWNFNLINEGRCNHRGS